MNKLLVALEPHGNQELGIAEMLDPKGDEVVYLLISGEGEIPVLEDGDIELRMYQDAGYNVPDREAMWDMQVGDEIPSVACEYDEYDSKYTETAIRMYGELGYTVERLPVLVMISPL